MDQEGDNFVSVSTFINPIRAQSKLADTLLSQEYHNMNPTTEMAPDKIKEEDPEKTNLDAMVGQVATPQSNDLKHDLPVETKTVFKSPPPPPPQQTPNNKLTSDEFGEAQSTSLPCLSPSLNVFQQSSATTSNQAPIQSTAQLAQSQPSTSSSVALPNQNIEKITSETLEPRSTLSSDGQQVKKRKKSVKKGAKLDVKLKLEKSRQSARECRARKKLRYQYLEDLVCNREKAVIILREELVKFCDISKQLDAGSSIIDSSLKLVKEQAKENNQLDI